MTKAQTAERAEAIERLREWIKPGDTVYTILESVSRSGMSRQIRTVVPYIRREVLGVDGQWRERDATIATQIYSAERETIDHLHPNHAIGLAIGARQAKKGDGLIIGGCGMDMGFHLVYALSHALYPEYPCLGQGGKCPSNYHVNHRVQADGPERWDLVHVDGYALRQRWL